MSHPLCLQNNFVDSTYLNMLKCVTRIQNGLWTVTLNPTSSLESENIELCV